VLPTCRAPRILQHMGRGLKTVKMLCFHMCRVFECRCPRSLPQSGFADRGSLQRLFLSQKSAVDVSSASMPVVPIHPAQPSYSRREDFGFWRALTLPLRSKIPQRARHPQPGPVLLHLGSKPQQSLCISCRQPGWSTLTHSTTIPCAGDRGAGDRVMGKDHRAETQGHPSRCWPLITALTYGELGLFL